MTQGISGRRDGGWSDAVSPAEGERLTPEGPPRDDLYLDDAPWPPIPLPPTALRPIRAPLMSEERDAQVKAGLDAFLESMNAPYRTPEGPARPGTTFQMSTPYAAQRASIARNAVALQRAAERAKLTSEAFARVRAGRGSPEAIHAVTQALIDAGPLPPPSLGSLDDRVRILMFDHGIGIDCAGYTQQAYLRATGARTADAHFGPWATEDLSNLGGRGYRRIEDVSAARPGDLVALGSATREPGHRVVVYAQHVASDAEVEILRGLGDEGRELARAGAIRVVQVDSSWGSSGDARLGGVRRETWWYSESSRTWGWTETTRDGGELRTAPTPLAHVFTAPFGIYRRKAGP